MGSTRRLNAVAPQSYKYIGDLNGGQGPPKYSKGSILNKAEVL